MASKNYINNKKLYECMQAYTARARQASAEGKPRPPVPEYVGECILLICRRMGTRFNFTGYSYRDEMVGDAIVDCVNAFYNFDSDRFSNPFGYFSMVAWRAMVRKIFNEKKETYLKHKSLQNAMLAGEQYDSPEHWQDPNANRSTPAEPVKAIREVTDGVVTDFENLLERRKKGREKTDKVEEEEKTDEQA